MCQALPRCRPSKARRKGISFDKDQPSAYKYPETGEKIPGNPKYGKKGQREGPGVYNPVSGLYEEPAESSATTDVAGSSIPETVPSPSGAGSGTEDDLKTAGVVVAGTVTVGVVVWWALKIFAPVCGPFVAVCVVAF